MALTVKDLDSQGLLRELAKVFDSEDQAEGLLWSIGMPQERRPPFRAAGNPFNFWLAVALKIEAGITAGGLEALLTAAAKQFPYNPMFAPYRTPAPPKPPPPPESGGSEGRAPVPRRTGIDTPLPSRNSGRSRVFLCHAVEDKPQVLPLYQRLKADGEEPWIDSEDLLPGQTWANEIQNVMRQSHAVIVCLSKLSVEKTGYVQKEIRMALEHQDERPEGKIFLIPARLEECTLPQSLGRIHWVDLFREGGYEKLLAALRTHRVDV